MITRDDIRELAQFEANRPEDCALSFFFQPATPRDKSHREEVILAKDLVRNAMLQAEKEGKNGSARADLTRILELAGSLHGNHERAKAVFACGSRGIWREFDLPPQLSGTQLFVNRRFHLKPLAMLLSLQPRMSIILVDRQRARWFDLRNDELAERPGMFHPLPRRGRSEGYAGYDAGHAQRRISGGALQHFKAVAARLKEEAEQGAWDKLIIGCQNLAWREFEPHLHPYVRQRLLGRYASDVASAARDRIREQATRVLRQSLEHRREDLVKEVLSQAKSNHHGVTGLRRVLRSLELGEVQTLLIGDNYSRAAVECTACGHLDSHMVRYCPACGRSTREIEDVCDAIVPAAMRRDVELLYIKDDPEFDRAGNIAALLRFRADQSKAGKLAAAS